MSEKEWILAKGAAGEGGGERTDRLRDIKYPFLSRNAQERSARSRDREKSFVCSRKSRDSAVGR